MRMTFARVAFMVIAIVVISADAKGQVAGSEQETSSGDTTRTVERTWVPDVNGRLVLVSQRIDETTTVTPDESRTVTVVLEPGINGPLQETRRIEETERRFNGGVRHDTTELMRDVNGRWHTVATRTAETTTTADGAQSSIEGIETPSLVAPSAPARLVQQTTITVRKIGPERWLRERHLYELDPNGRMVLVESSTHETK